MALVWAKHRFAERYLAAMSFAESVFFPVPPDVMLAPMSLAQPSKAWRFASFATVASVLGGIVGYFLGGAKGQTIRMQFFHTFRQLA